MFNSLCLMIFASLLASCQKTKFPKTGHFSQFHEVSRSIASTEQSVADKFTQFQDPKQIIMFCLINSKKPKTCYLLNLKEKLSEFSTKEQKLSLDEQKELTQKFNYDSELAILNKASNTSLDIYQDQFTKIVQKRKHFCEKNSKIDLQKCLEQYLKRDTFTLLNNFQNKNKLNAIEYVFMIDKIQNKLVSFFESAKLEIKSDRRKSI